MIWQMVLSKVTGTRSFKFSNSSNAPSILFETVIKECLRRVCRAFQRRAFFLFMCPIQGRVPAPERASAAHQLPAPGEGVPTLARVQPRPLPAGQAPGPHGGLQPV